MIPFNKPTVTEVEESFMKEALSIGKLCGDGKFTKDVRAFFEERFGIKHFLLTTSCSHALDMSAILCDLKEGDEIIAPSYTFVSTINAFVLRGARPVFCEIDPETMNIDPERIEELITPRTRAIYAVHYAGVVCDMDRILEIAEKHGLFVIEDAAQAVGSVYKGERVAGTIGDMGTYSFHETKNYAMGEGGALIVRDTERFRRAEIIREKGTDRSQFIRGEVDKYTWKSVGSSYLPSDVLAAMLYGQLTRFDEIMERRLHIWNTYRAGLMSLERAGKLRLPRIPSYSTHNAHMFYLILPTKEIRDEAILALRERGVQSVFHYIPLHSSPMGQSFGYKKEDLPITEEYAGRLLRLPLFFDMKDEEVQHVIDAVRAVL